MQKNTKFKLLYNQLWLVDEQKLKQINPELKIDNQRYIANNGETMRDKVAVLMSEHNLHTKEIQQEIKPQIKREAPAVLTVTPKVNVGNPEQKEVALELITNWDRLIDKASKCLECDLHHGRKNVVIERGNRNAKWMFIGESPSAQEDIEGVPFIGATGELLDKMITAMKLNVVTDVYICNVVKCKTPANQNPEIAEIEVCKQYLLSQIELVQPRIIIAMGRFASFAITGSDLVTNKLRGKINYYKNIPVIVTYHPSYLLRNTDAKKDAWADLQLAMKVFKDNENTN